MKVKTYYSTVLVLLGALLFGCSLQSQKISDPTITNSLYKDAENKVISLIVNDELFQIQEWVKDSSKFIAEINDTLFLSDNNREIILKVLSFYESPDGKKMSFRRLSEPKKKLMEYIVYGTLLPRPVDEAVFNIPSSYLIKPSSQLDRKKKISEVQLIEVFRFSRVAFNDDLNQGLLFVEFINYTNDDLFGGRDLYFFKLEKGDWVVDEKWPISTIN